MNGGQRSALRALVARNAKACEEAKQPECRCPCGGVFHGKAHGDGWVAEQVSTLELEHDERRTQLALFNPDDLEGDYAPRRVR